MLKARILWIPVLSLMMMLVQFPYAGAAESYQPDPTINGVTLQGLIKLAGQPKISAPISVYRDSHYCGETIFQEDVAVDPSTNGLSGVVVSLVGVERGKALIASDSTLVLEIESEKCRFSPHLSAVAVGTQLEIRNNDPILHDLRIRRDTRFGPTLMNIMQPAGTRSVHKPLQEMGHFDVRCDIHAFMSAFIHVFDHPYFAITDSTGSFHMTDVPPGIYTLQIWHEQFGVREKSIKVPPGEGLTVNLEMGKNVSSFDAKPAR
jgi:plastocyanin